MAFSKVREKHGLSGTAEFRIWSDLFSRCHNPKNAMYKYYGGRGIHVCPAWARFTQFWADMGLRPSKQHSIDRVNNDGNYEAANCRWATRQEQAQNTSRNVYLTHQGKTLCLAQWARITGLAEATLSARSREGLPPEQILACARQWKMLTYNGETLPYRTWARRLGIPETTFVRRITKGWPVDMVMAEPQAAAAYAQQRYWANYAQKAQERATQAAQRAQTNLQPGKRKNYAAAVAERDKLVGPKQ